MKDVVFLHFVDAFNVEAEVGGIARSIDEN